jgi:hypothetical protein
MNKIKCIFFVMCATLICSFATAQVSDSIPVKTSIFSKLNFSKIQLPKVHMPKLNLFKKDSVTKAKKLKVEPQINASKEVAEVSPVDTLKSSWTLKEKFSKIRLPKFNFLKKDSSIVKTDELTVKNADATIIEKVKDTAKKTSFLTKLRFNKKAELKTDSSIVVAPVVEKVKDTNSLYKSMKEKFFKYTATTTVSLLSGANFSKQTVDVGGYNSNFNYIYSDINNDVYKTGYFGGIRLDGMVKKKHEYSLSVSLSKLSSGASYINSTSLGPVVGSFSTFKAEDHFFIMNIAAHYKKLIPYGDLDKFKFYVVGGPSIDARLSNMSLNNKVNNAYKQIFIKGNVGVEFNNRSLYTMFLHYQHNIGSLTKAPIKTNINTFQLGIMVKAADLL